MPQDSQGSYFFDDLQQFLGELESYLEESDRYLKAAHKLFGSKSCNFSAMSNCVNTSKKQVSNLRYNMSNRITKEEEKYYLQSLYMLINKEY
jgi:hypothetical protein